MIRGIAVAALAVASLAAAPLWAEQPGDAQGVTPAANAPTSPETQPREAQPAPASETLLTPEAVALRAALAALDTGETDEERNEHAALVSFYEARSYAPLWLAPSGGLMPKAAQLVAEIKRAEEWGLDARDFAVPSEPERGATAELRLSLAVLKYGRYARGGRIIFPAEQLSSYLDRRPQLLKPRSILDGIAAADAPDAYLCGLNPQHPQFEQLRQKYLALIARGTGERASAKPRPLSGEAKRLRANMEQWRWMPADMGEVYVWNNVPEFLQRVVKNGEVLRAERIVAGEIGKQTPIFTRPMRRITFKPQWKVPESIKVREIWPSLARGGSVMRDWGLELYTKDGQRLDWRKMDWARTDIREYDVIQPNGGWSVMGKVKFSFPNQHTVFMHDTLDRDKYMFNAAQRTYSHGCMRVNNPMGLAEVLLREDKGWDAAHVLEVFKNGPANNEIPIEHKIPVHTTYFTAWVSDDGKLHTVPDVYGHERRITQALDGKWDQIVRGRDHLAPVELNLAGAAQRGSLEDGTSELPGPSRSKHKDRSGSLLDAILGTF